MCNIAVVSVHTSPLARPGTRDSGGMNVYIRQLSQEMGRRAHTMDIFTRRTDPDTPEVTVIDERTRVIQIDAGAPGAEKASLRRFLPAFRDGVLAFQQTRGTVVRPRAQPLLALGLGWADAEDRVGRAARDHVPHAGRGEEPRIT